MIAFLVALLPQNSFAQDKTLLLKLLQQHPQQFEYILKNPERYEVQILYTQINRDKQNRPTFKTFSYRADSTFYFYPASTVKMALSFLALERINQLQKTIPNLTKDTPYRLDSLRPQQIPFSHNPLAQKGLPTIAQDIKEIMLVSDNYAYNHLLEFMGRDYINEKLATKGYHHSRVMHRFSIPGIDNRVTMPMIFYDATSQKNILQLGEQVSVQSYTNRQKNLLKGKGYWNSNDSLINGAFDFSTKNYFALHDQQMMLRAVLFPQSVAPHQRFELTPTDYSFLRKYMSMLPRESSYPTYDSTHYDGYCKFLMWGDNKQRRPQNIRIFNKVGDAYGYMIDNAYIVDFDKKIEFMLTAVILSNEDGIFNDGKYEYETIGMPFFGNLGRVIYDYELQRKRKNVPNLEEFRP